jgi:SAM-dependent methyltransferase
LLAEAGATVFAVEPNAPMRAQIAANPNVTTVDGTAEATTLADACVDIVTAFQAYHWFKPEETLAEVERILRVRGRFAAVWNERDERDPLMHAYGEIIAPFMTDATEQRRSRSRTMLADLHERRWGNIRVVEHQNVAPVDWDGFIGRTRSASYLPREGSAYEEMAAQLRALFDRADEYGGARFVMVTSAYLAERQ